MDGKTVNKLKQWFIEKKRDFPWRDEPSPYAVWVSEVMLQQTQASVVVPYFLRWMERFPTIDALAKAPQEVVLKAWEGLGYYSRARNLHYGAREVVANHNGKLPTDPVLLKNIKGIGAYTLGAIRSFAFHQRAAAVDGNVLRLLARFYAIKDSITKSKTRQEISELAERLLPLKEPWIISEALIELGATLCGRQPRCLSCPLKEKCRAFALGEENTLPIKGPSKAIKKLYRLVPVIFSERNFLVGRGKSGKIMAGLWEFPFFEHDDLSQNKEAQKSALELLIMNQLSLSATWQQELPHVKHSFTCHYALLMPHLYQVAIQKKISGYDWVAIEELSQRPFSSGHRRIFELASNNFKYL